MSTKCCPKAPNGNPGSKAPSTQLVSSNPEGSAHHKLGAGKSVVSKNGQYLLVLEEEGKGLNLYSTAPKKILWSAPGSKLGQYAELRPNGSLVVVDEKAKTVWSSGGGPGKLHGPFTLSITVRQSKQMLLQMKERDERNMV